MATTSAGGGLTMLRNVCTNMDIPQPISEKPYSHYIKYQENKIKNDCDRSMSFAAQKLHENIEGDTLMVHGRSEMASTHCMVSYL